MKKFLTVILLGLLSCSLYGEKLRWRLLKTDHYRAGFEISDEGAVVTLTKLTDSKDPATILVNFSGGSFNLTAGDVIISIEPEIPQPVVVVPCLESLGGALFPQQNVFRDKVDLHFTAELLVKGTFTQRAPNPARIALLRLKIHGMKKDQTLKWKISNPQKVESGAAQSAVQLPPPGGTIRNRATTFEQLRASIKPVKAPIYLMEYHIWYENAYTRDGRLCFQHWREGGNPHDLEINAPLGAWRRYLGSPGMPLAGYYHSPSLELQRWQIACMKRSGVSGAFVQLFTSQDGLWWDHMLPIFETALEEAARQGFHLGVHDEVHFRSAVAQDPDVCARRWAATIRRYGDHPGYLKINGRPVIQFQHWGGWRNNRVTVDQLTQAMRKAEELAGREICFIPMTTPDAAAAGNIPGGYAVVLSGNSNMLATNTGKPFRDNRQDWQAWQQRMDSCQPLAGILRRNGAQAWLWGYGVYNETCYSTVSGRWLDSDGGRTLIRLLELTDAAAPDAILLSSWNDWRENTALEPGLCRDDYNNDPYLYCRILAAAKGLTFEPPPLPPREVVDPLLWSRLYGIDRTPPEITSAYYAPLDPALMLQTYDAESPVTGAKIMRYGNHFIRFGESAAASKAVLVMPSSPETVNISGQIPAQIAFTGVTFSTEDVPYLFLSYKDTGKGKITVSFQSDPERLNFNILGELTFTTTGDGRCHQVMIPIRRWRKNAAGEARITLTFAPAYDRRTQTYEESENAVVELLSAALVYDFSGAMPGLPSFPGERYGDTYRFNGIAAEGKVEDWVFIQSSDKAGNFSRPLAIDLSKLDPLRVQPVDLTN